MDNVKVAVIDTGIDLECKYLKNVNKKGCHIFWDHKIKYDKNYMDDNGHGTACASTIYRECKDIELSIIKVLDNSGKSNILAIEEALRYLLNENVDIINMSFSIPKVIDSDLYKLCRQLQLRNKILVASCDNEQKVSFPSSFETVIGVKGVKLNHINQIQFNAKEKIQCIVDNTPSVSITLHNRYQMRSQNNSLATAKMTGIIANLINEYRRNHGSSELNYLQIVDLISEYALQNRKKGICTREELTNCYVSDTNPIIKEIHGLIKGKKTLFRQSENLCDYELLTSRGCLKFDDVNEFLSLINKKLNKKVDFLNLSRYDLLTLGTIAKYIENN